ncbi:MAG: hypothetical protein B5M56_07585 [Desulfococcus sp. 4484_241]|nr:MAG: hypothetical protein B5M56_07585 [Desulfococcus sp. 4484_241]
MQPSKSISAADPLRRGMASPPKKTFSRRIVPAVTLPVHARGHGGGTAELGLLCFAGILAATI